MTVEVPRGVKVVYRQEYRRCGRQGCSQCGPGQPGHGPYWYANWSEDGRRRKVYLGRKTPVEVLGPGGTYAEAPAFTPATGQDGQADGRHGQHQRHGGASTPAEGQDGQADARASVSSEASIGVALSSVARPSPASAVATTHAPVFGPGVLRVRTLGGFQVLRDGRPLSEGSWSLRKAGELFKCLLSAPLYRSRRESLIDALWPEVEIEAGRRNLRGSLHQLRRLLDGPEAGQSHIQEVGDVLVLAPALDGSPPEDWLDAETFPRAAGRARAGRDATACRAALALYGGEYLPDDRYEEWAQPRREALRAEYLALLLHAAMIQAEGGDYPEAEVHLTALLRQDPCHEEAAARLMGVLVAQGRRSAAIRVYDALATALDEELGLQPGKEVRTLHARLRAAARAPVAAEVLPERPVHERRSNLPAALTSFIGRGQVAGELEERLADTDGAGCRLLTLHGAGGAGKTRLSQAVGERLLARDAYGDGVWLVELAPCARPDLVAETVARVLGMREEPSAPSDDAMIGWLIAFLQPRRLLLILDNCEHLIDACAHLAGRLLQACPGLRILATSREPLGVAGEVLYRVPSLTLPDPAAPLPPPDALEEYEAVALFVARARARRTDFVLTTDTAATVVAICRRLDGIPLAIELAAARIIPLGVEGIAARLDDRFRLLTGGPRTALPRQQTLRAALDWSYTLLDARDRLLLGRLAVFAGGWTLEAAEQVCAGGEIEAGEILDLLDGLVARSLVHSEESGDAVRYTFLETIRHYARERLAETDEGRERHRRHASWCLALAEEAEPGLRGPDQAAWLLRLETEHPNIRAALGWLSEQPDEAEQGLRLAGVLWRFWSAHGHIHEGLACLEEMLEATAGTAPGADAAAESRRRWRAARALALNGAGNLAQYAGDMARSRVLHEQALEIRRALGDPLAIAGSLGNLGNTAHHLGDLEAAAAYYAEALPLFREAGNNWAVAAGLGNLGPIIAELGEPERGEAMLEESLALRRELQDTWGIAITLKSLAGAALDRGDPARGAALAEEALALRRSLGDQRATAESLTTCAAVAEAQGDPARAWTLLQEALRLSRAVHDRAGLGYELWALVSVLRALCQPEGAAHVLAASDRLFQTLGIIPPARQQRERAATLAWCEERLSRQALEGEMAGGAARTLEGLLEWILGAPAPSAGHAISIAGPPPTCT